MALLWMFCVNKYAGLMAGDGKSQRAPKPNWKVKSPAGIPMYVCVCVCVLGGNATILHKEHYSLTCLKGFIVHLLVNVVEVREKRKREAATQRSLTFLIKVSLVLSSYFSTSCYSAITVFHCFLFLSFFLGGGVLIPQKVHLKFSLYPLLSSNIPEGKK